jgi:tetratricopeptide (TPR) repeat protein
MVSGDRPTLLFGWVLSLFLLVNIPLLIVAEDDEQGAAQVYNRFLLPPDIAHLYFPDGQNYLIPEGDNTAIVIGRARDFEMKKNYRQATRYYSIAYQRAKGTRAAPYIRFKQCSLEDSISSSIRCLTELINDYPDFPLINGVRFELAFRHYIGENYDDAMKFLGEIEENESGQTVIFTPYSHTFSGIIKARQGRYDDALFYFEHALDGLRLGGVYTSEDYIKIYIEISKTLISLEKLGQAQDLLLRIYGTADSPILRAEALYQLAVAFGLDEQPQKASAAYLEISSKYPSSPFTPKAIKALNGLDQNGLTAVLGVYDETILSGTYMYGAPEILIPESPDTLSQSSGFLIQIGAFTEESNAQELIRSLEEKGFPAFFIGTGVEGNQLFKVRVGFYPSREEAEEVLQNLTAMGFSGFIVEEN